ncbi:MAG: UvrD-helicase domain-containing protein [Cyclobacteriaceae bacterium]|nr:UvrD-helicase domain-containing protein [Cyclobacteriaceae bacterium]
METRPFIVYRSSAGSGKTYTLTKEYLTLALRFNNYYRHILAVTFTNKATRELKERIMESLYRFSQGKSDPMAEEIRQVLEVSEKEFIRRSGNMLHDILHQYGHFSVSTIDSFFQRIIRSFAREAGIQGNFKLEMDEELVVDEAVASLLEDVGKNKVLSEWLLRFSEDMLEENQSWDITKRLNQLGMDLLGENFKPIEKQFSHLEDQGQKLHLFQDELFKISKSFENKLREFGQAGLAIMHNHGLEYTDFAFGKGGVGNYFVKLSNGIVEKGGARVDKALEDISGWHSAKSDKKEVITSAVEEGLMEALQDCRLYFDEGIKDYGTAKAVLHNFYTFGIITDILGKIRDYKVENDMMLISDSSSFLSGIIADYDGPFIYEKVGSQYNHYLIDEFQDTSILQWKNFKPLIANAISSGFRSFVVGDVKQSIYRWRGGDWRLLDHQVINEFGRADVEIKNLNTNYRSTPEVIRFNNVFFKEASKLLAYVFDPGENAGNKFSDVYRDVEQAGRENPSGSQGYVNITLLEGDEAENWKAGVLEKLPKLIEDLQDRGYPASSIAILVRKSGEGQQVARTLLEYARTAGNDNYSYDLVSEDVLKIGSAGTIQFLISVLRWIDNPKDEIAKGTIISCYAYLFSSGNLCQHEMYQSIGEGSYQDWLPIKIAENHARWVSLQLYELIEELIRCFNLQNLIGEKAYLESFQDLVLQYVSSASGDLHTFLSWWDDEGVDSNLVLSGELNAIRILTIHKSKGLQFPVVIIPFCEWPLDHPPRFSPTIWVHSGRPPYAEWPFLPVKYGKKLEDTYFEGDYLEEKRRVLVDNLNLLYVAFTRPENELFVFSNYSSNQKNMGNISDVLYLVLKSELAEKENFYLAERGAPGNFVSQPKSENKLVVEHFASGQWNEKVRIATRSGLHPEIVKKIVRGEVIHEILARIESVSAIHKPIEEMVKSGRISLSESDDYRIALDEIFTNEKVREWFSVKGLSRSECTLFDGAGNIKRPDRVIETSSHIIVIDFKTGVSENSHHQQINAYIDILKKLTGKITKGYLMYTQPFEIVEI